MADTLSAAEAGLLAHRGRKLLRLGRVTHHQLALLDALLWSCRRAGKATVRVSYSQIQAAAHLARSTVAAGLRALEALGLLQRQRHRLLVVGQNGGRVWKQLPSTYRLLECADSREFAARTDSQSPDIILLGSTTMNRAVEDAQRALKALAETRAAKQAAEWRRARGWS